MKHIFIRKPVRSAVWKWKPQREDFHLASVNVNYFVLCSSNCVLVRPDKDVILLDKDECCSYRNIILGKTIQLLYHAVL